MRFPKVRIIPLPILLGLSVVFFSLNSYAKTVEEVVVGQCYTISSLEQ